LRQRYTLHPSPVVSNVNSQRLYAVPDPIECSCVKYAETLVPGIPVINAIDYPLNTIEPQVGDIIKIQYYNATTTRYIYHLQVIREITPETYKVEQGNKPSCATSTEDIKKDDERILGFFSASRQKLIDSMSKVDRQTLWNESGWSQYDTNGAVLRGRDGEWGVAQFMPSTWKWLSQLRQAEHLRMLDRMDFEDQIEMFHYGKTKGVVWYGKPESVVSE